MCSKLKFKFQTKIHQIQRNYRIYRNVKFKTQESTEKLF